MCIYIYAHMYVYNCIYRFWIYKDAQLLYYCLFVSQKNSWEVCFEPKRAKDPESTQVDMTNVVKTIITNH
jgi:hypothetical protein